MSATSMPPPPSPLARRRTRLNQQTTSTTCSPRNMSLSKGATFHVASSPYTDADPVLSIPYLSRRSPTCSHSSLSSLLSEKRDVAAQHIADFEQTFSGARGNRRSAHRQSAEEFNQQLKSLRAALPTDEGLGSSIASPASDKGISKTLAQVELASNKDSALGESIQGSVTGPDSAAIVLVQETDKSDNEALQPKKSGTTTHKHTLKPSLLPSARTSYHPALSRFARKKITELVIQPILREERFKDFHPLVGTLALRTHKNIRCLRDLEQSLIYQPLARNFSVSPSLYRSFGEFTVQLTVDTFQHLSESDQRRTTDQAYTSGYFLDLVQQIQQLAAHVGSSSRADGEEDPDAPSFDDEITLEGGLASTGELAELVRWKNGQGISLRTGLPYEAVPGMKRQASSMTQEDIARSMARRKKGYIPEIVEMECSDPTCDKIFTRKCDLAKHEKTHSRPFKCPFPTCKYSEVGLPTEKEKERHINDKHDPNPQLYRCKFCEFKTKRESNCKQHMEKKHGWEYKRAKGKDKDTGSTPAQTPVTPAMDYDMSTAMVQPSPAQASYHTFDDGSSISGSLAGSAQFTPFDEPINDVDTFNPYSAPLFPRQAQTNQFGQSNNFGFDTTNAFNGGFDQLNGYVSPISNGQNVKMTPVTPAFSTITGNSPYMTTNNQFNNNQCYGFNDGLPTPESAAHHSYSRHASVQFDSPSNFEMERNLSNHMMGQVMDDVVGGGDFQLFDPAFTNPAARNETLFPATEDFSQKYTEADFAAVQMDLDLEDYNEPAYRDEFDDMVNFDN